MSEEAYWNSTLTSEERARHEMAGFWVSQQSAS